jgi:hypothetical protein
MLTFIYFAGHAVGLPKTEGFTALNKPRHWALLIGYCSGFSPDEWFIFFHVACINKPPQTLMGSLSILSPSHD